MITQKCSMLVAALVLIISCPTWAEPPSRPGAQDISTVRTTSDSERECSSQLGQSKLPAQIKTKVAKDCAENPQKFVQAARRSLPKPSGGNTFDANSLVEGPCSSCTAYCQTITFLNTYDWGADLGGGMSPSQCADAASSHCGAAWNTLLNNWHCEQ